MARGWERCSKTLLAVRTGLAVGLAVADFVGVGLQSGRFFGEFELRTGREVLDVVLQVVRARQGLTADIDLASGEGETAASHHQEQGRVANPGKASVS